MRPAGRTWALLAALVLVMVPPPPAVAEPADFVEVHIEEFADGSEAVEGEVGPNLHLATEIEVPAGAEVLSASVDLARVRHLIHTIPLDASPRTLWKGRLDPYSPDEGLVVTYPGADRVDVITVTGDPPAISLVTSIEVPDPTAVEMSDLDRDRDHDLLVTSGRESKLYIFEADGMAHFLEPRIILVGTRPCAVEAAELNPDFKTDVVVANTGGASLTVLKGRGGFSFYPQRLEVGSGPSALYIGPINDDLHNDIVVAESRNSTVSVLLNLGNGNFTGPDALPAGEGPIDLAVRRIDGDSRADIATVCSGTGRAMVWRQTSEAGFELWEDLVVGAAPRAVDALQVNRDEDQRRDVVVACSGSDNLTVYLSDGSYNHTLPFEVPVGGRPVDVVTYDATGDDVEDLLAICQDPPALVVAETLPVAEVLHAGLGTKGFIGTVDLPIGTDRATLDLTSLLSYYVVSHHSEAAAGVLRVPIAAWAEVPGFLRFSDLDVWCVPNRPPRAVPGADMTVLVGEEVELDGSASYDPEGEIAEWRWLLPGGDGQTLKGKVVTWSWDEPGEYFILLVALDPWGLQDQDSVMVTVNAPPLARGTVPDTVHAREEARLSAHLSSDPDGSIVDYVWDYGQGVVHGRAVDVLFTGSGTVTVTLEVIDDLGGRATASYDVQVLPAKEALREPGERVPEDEGEVPGPGAVTVLAACLVSAGLARWRRRGARAGRDPHA